jgi:hypothetical protein
MLELVTNASFLKLVLLEGCQTWHGLGLNVHLKEKQAERDKDLPETQIFNLPLCFLVSNVLALFRSTGVSLWFLGLDHHSTHRKWRKQPPPRKRESILTSNMRVKIQKQLLLKQQNQSQQLSQFEKSLLSLQLLITAPFVVEDWRRGPLFCSMIGN